MGQFEQFKTTYNFTLEEEQRYVDMLLMRSYEPKLNTVNLIRLLIELSDRITELEEKLGETDG